MVLRGRVRTEARDSQRATYSAVRLASFRPSSVFSWLTALMNASFRARGTADAAPRPWCVRIRAGATGVTTVRVKRRRRGETTGSAGFGHRFGRCLGLLL